MAFVAAGSPATRRSSGQPVTPFQQTSPLLLGKRQRNGEEMAVDILGNPLRGLEKRTKKLKRFIRSSPHPPSYDESSLLPAYSSTPNSDPVVSCPIGKVDIGGTSYYKHHNNEEDTPELLLMPNETESTLEALQDRYAKAQYDIADLQDALRKQSEQAAQEKMFLKQEMMFDMIRRHELSNQTVNKLMREKHYMSQYANEQKAEADKQKKKAEEEVRNHEKTKSDLTYFKGEVDHLQALNKVLEEDLDELRQIENEDSAHRKRREADLPPAYGSLDDEDRYPPTLKVHSDGGTFDVAVFKRQIRSSFMLKVTSAQTKARTWIPASQLQSSSVFFTASTALQDSCQSLKPILDMGQDSMVTKLKRQVEKVDVATVEGSVSKSVAKHLHTELRLTFKRDLARHDYIASRVASLIIDLCWRVISACELRPYTLNLSQKEKSRLNLAYLEIDTTLLDSLRLLFMLKRFGFKKDVLLGEYQHFLTQMAALRRGFGALGSGLTCGFFPKSFVWLEEQVESERCNLANTDPQEEQRARRGEFGERDEFWEGDEFERRDEFWGGDGFLERDEFLGVREGSEISSEAAKEDEERSNVGA